MTLRQKQSRFAYLLGILLVWIYAHKGWEVTLGEGHNDAQVGHMPGSLHYQRLAQDLNLFIDGVYIASWHPVWEQIGEFWVNLDSLCRWGGHFDSKDYNHISITEGGKA